jgi:large subunit ribosomal protein L21
MFAVIKTGGKQYTVREGTELIVEKLECESGSVVQIDDILLWGDGDRFVVGSPCVDGSTVTVDVVRHQRREKVINFKKRRRKHGSKRKKGHRQQETVIRVVSIFGPTPEGDRGGLSSSQRSTGKANGEKAVSKTKGSSSDKKNSLSEKKLVSDVTPSKASKKEE